EPRFQMVRPAGIFRHDKPVVRRVCCTGGDEAHIGKRTCSPRVTFVDRVSMGIDLQRTIEVGAFFNGPLTVVLNHSVPKDDSSVIVDSLEIKPDIEGVDCSSRKVMPDLSSTNNDIETISHTGRYHDIAS